MSLSVVGGLGSILTVFIDLYAKEGVSVTKVSWLTTFPSLFIGIGKAPRSTAYGDRESKLMPTLKEIISSCRSDLLSVDAPSLSLQLLCS